jgi:hypothetical protein
MRGFLTKWQVVHSHNNNYFQIVHDAIKEVQKWILGQSLYD